MGNVSWFCFVQSVWVITYVAGFNNCKVSDYKATIWTWTLTRDAWGCEEWDRDPASCSGLKARGARSECGENNFPRLNIIPHEEMTLKPMHVHWNLSLVVDLSEDDCEYWWPEAVQLPSLCKYLTSHKFCDTVSRSSQDSHHYCVLRVSKSQK